MELEIASLLSGDKQNTIQVGGKYYICYFVFTVHGWRNPTISYIYIYIYIWGAGFVQKLCIIPYKKKKKKR